MNCAKLIKAREAAATVPAPSDEALGALGTKFEVEQASTQLKCSSHQ